MPVKVSLMLLMLDYGIFYEFMPMEEYGKPNPKTIELCDVEVGQQYALVISTNGGLWRYLLGDTVRFTSVEPYRIQVSGRTRHYINAFGEELMIENADDAILYACRQTGAEISEYTAAPVYMDNQSTGAHEWCIEFTKSPVDLQQFAALLDERLRLVNSDYDAKRAHDFILRAPVLRSLDQGAFHAWMKSMNKLGGQNKVPRLCNDRRYVDELLVHASQTAIL